MLRRRFLACLAAAALAAPALAAAPASAAGHFIVVASTTSTQDSGLYEYLLPIFTQRTGIEVRVVAKGTGEAIRLAEHGDADVLLVHDTKAEEAFVAAGYGVRRYPLMYNDFVIVGPASDPAGIKGTRDAPAALAAIVDGKNLFVSRGDDSGTNRAEMRLWLESGVNPKTLSNYYYWSTGSGMGQTLNTAAAMGAYTLSDRATWVAFKNKRDLALMVQGDPRLYNQYGVTLVNPRRFPHVNAADGQAFIDWLVSPEGQRTIAGFRVDGQQLFVPNAGGF
ncbi:MAG: substrate-binding domain-containing protein [Dongiaceae bacterium]